MRLGFTGTREEPTQAQIDWLTEFFRQEKPTELHHGACVGSDWAAHRVAAGNFAIVVHPPIDERLMVRASKLMIYRDVLILPPAPYLERNRHIVDNTDRLVAFSRAGDDMNTMKSGTWATVRYAKSQGKPVDVIYPDGQARKYN